VVLLRSIGTDRQTTKRPEKVIMLGTMPGTRDREVNGKMAG